MHLLILSMSHRKYIITILCDSVLENAPFHTVIDFELIQGQPTYLAEKILVQELEQ